MKPNDARKRWRPGVLIGITAMLAASALMLAACGGGGSSGADSTTASVDSGGSGTEVAGAQGGAPGGLQMSDEQRACLKEKGVELPEFKAGAGGMPPQGGEMPAGGPPGAAAGAGGEKLEEQKGALEECGVELPELKGPAGQGAAPSTNSAAFRKQVDEYVACVRENGYELAEPDFSGAGPIFEKAESESAAFKKASAQCQGLLGGPQGGESESS